MFKTKLIILRTIAVVLLTVAMFFITADYTLVPKEEVEAQCVALPQAPNDDCVWYSWNSGNFRCPAGSVLAGANYNSGDSHEWTTFGCCKIY
ncbi:hypothetical protein MNBD_UNCLBAC01-1687 [hydrothermal vent metagenome]|uniref:Uncharacterized protein n=1 Tax=hydrothermal vent metagenome TaxID=652676 RepID=A0A3B1CZE6_9ZZZZ